jgi:hypothetical protein
MLGYDEPSAKLLGDWRSRSVQSERVSPALLGKRYKCLLIACAILCLFQLVSTDENNPFNPYDPRY